MKLLNRIDAPNDLVEELVRFAAKGVALDDVWVKVIQYPAFASKCIDYEGILENNRGVRWRVAIYMNPGFKPGCLNLMPDGKCIAHWWSKEAVDSGLQPVSGWQDALVLLAAYAFDRKAHFSNQGGGSKEQSVKRAKAALRAYKTL